ncbi:MATE family efflux transporter [Lachnospiraceae bacterium NSJ-143]|nr:MATE family efflux transporter [Lachnospiraceae bacterium NSJ-143]
MTGADSSIIPYAMPYYIIVAGPCVFLCLQLILSSCLRAVEDTKTPMYVTVATNIIKILLTMLFVKMGMGIFGLGLATTLSRVIGTVVLLVCLQRHDKNISLSFCKLTGKEFSPILRIGIPAGMEKLIMKMGQLIYIGMVIRLGTSAYVAHNIASNIDNLAWSCAMGFGLAACTMVGISLGQDNIEQAKKLTTTANFISVITLSVIGVFIFIFARQLAAIFTKTEELQDIIVPILRIVAIIQPFSALLQNMTSVLQGAGDTKFPMYSTFVGIWGIRDCIGFLFAVYFNMGLIGCWFAYSLDVVIRGVLLLLRFNRGKWQKIKI